MNQAPNPNSNVPPVTISVDKDVAPLFQEGGVYEGQVLHVDPDSVTGVIGSIEETNRRNSHGAWGFEEGNRVEVRITASPEDAAATTSFVASKDGRPDVARIGLPLQATDTVASTKEFGANTQGVLDEIERKTSIGKVGAVALAPLGLFTDPVGYARHLKRLHTIKEGTKANKKQRAEAAKVALEVSEKPIVTISSPESDSR